MNENRMKSCRAGVRMLLALLSVLLTLSMLITAPVSASAEVPAEPALQAEATLGSCGAQLPPSMQQLYLFLRTGILQIADGTRTSTVFEIDEAMLTSWGFKLTWTKEELGVDNIVDLEPIKTAFFSQLQIDLMLEALMYDHPYELAWYDKQSGVSYNYSYNRMGYESQGVTQVNSVTFTKLTATFSVSADYRPDNYNPKSPTVDPTEIQRAKNAVAYAKALVEQYASYSDYEKLAAYRDAICALTDYNDAAVSPSYAGGYGDPWQLVYVFDQDPSTQVVCEGYSKAFQYLCDLSSFEGQVTCYTVGGVMEGGTGAGGHMWNVVVMGDGKSYLVDITNSDVGTVGANGELFLAGGTGSVTAGYTVQIGYFDSIFFVYDAYTVEFWGTDAQSMLSLSDTSYQPTEIVISIPTPLVYTGEALTVGFADTDIICFCQGGESVTQSYSWSASWYTDRNGQIGTSLREAPKNAGTYWLRVSARSKNNFLDVQSKSIRVTVEKAMPQYTLPTNLSATYGSTLSAIALPTGFAWQDDPTATAVGNVGVRSFLVTYTPTDTQNYHTVRDISVDLSVAKATPIYQLPDGLTAAFGDRLSAITLPAGFAWQGDASTDVGAVGLNTHKLTYNPDPSNYLTVSDLSVTVTVTKRNIANAVIVLGDMPMYNGALQTQVLTSVTADGVPVPTYLVSGNTATEIGVYTLTVTGEGNFEGMATIVWRLSPDLSPINGITVDNVKETHVEAIHQIKLALSDQSADWSDLLTHCEALLQRVDAVRAELTALTEDTATVDGLSKESLTALSNRLSALLDGDNLTAEARTSADAMQEKVSSALEKLAADKNAEIEKSMEKIVIIIAAAIGVVIVWIVIAVVISKKRQ